MTTICWDGQILAGDGRITCGTRIECDNYKKLYKLHNTKYYDDTLLYLAIAGQVGHIDLVLKQLHIEKFQDMDEEAEHEIAGIIVGKLHVYYLEEESLHLSKFDRDTPLSAGSGSAFATSAMNLGLNARQAVKHAMKFDSCTGGKIRTVKL